MTELTPRIQRLLEKLSKQLDTQDLPVDIHINQNGIEVSTSRKDYTMKRAKEFRKPIGDIINRNLQCYKRDIMNAQPVDYQIPEIEGTIEAKVTHYLSNYELGQTQRKTSIQLEALAGLGTIIHPYLNIPQEMKTIWKIISSKGHPAYNLCKIARRTLELVEARGSETLRDYQYLTPNVIYRTLQEDWLQLVNTANLQYLLEQAVHIDEENNS